jgi:tripartite motif-containing protein 2/3
MFLMSRSGITNYPIGVGINAAGEIAIADNHNNFNLTIFSQDGQVSSNTSNVQ